MKRIDWSELRPQISLVWRLSLPAILTQITTIAMQYIDSAMVGALGANASAAIGLVSTSTWLLSGITYAITAGFSVQVAHHIGAKHDEDARTAEAKQYTAMHRCISLYSRWSCRFCSSIRSPHRFCSAAGTW